MSINTAAILRGPALVQWRGATFYHRDKLEIPMEAAMIDVLAEPFGVVAKRMGKPSFPINITPSGRVTEVAALINRYASSIKGDLINVEEYPVTVTNASDLLTCSSNHLLADGDEVMVHSLLTMPGGLSKTTRYYARVTGNSATTLKLYDTEAHAKATGSTDGLINISSDGSGVVLDITRPLIITTYKGLRIKYYNVGLTSVPNLEFSASKQMLGQATFRAFVRNGADPDSPASSYYVIDTANVSDTSFDPADIKTQSPKVSWAFDAAWTDLGTKEGVTVAFDLQTSTLPNDAFGDDALGLVFGDLNLTVTAAVQGITEAEAKAGLQAQAKQLGEHLTGGALEIVTPFYTFTVADALLSKAPQDFSVEQRGGNFEWVNQKTFTAGVKDPTYELVENE